MIRIVKMSFRAEATNQFLGVFREAQPRIASFPGCSHVELIRDIYRPEIMMTYSIWESEAALENYRQSELFQTTWAKTKILFNDKPQAWSLEQVNM